MSSEEFAGLRPGQRVIFTNFQEMKEEHFTFVDWCSSPAWPNTARFDCEETPARSYGYRLLGIQHATRLRWP